MVISSFITTKKIKKSTAATASKIHVPVTTTTVTKKYFFFLFVLIGVTFQFATVWKYPSSPIYYVQQQYNELGDSMNLPTTLTISGISKYMTTKYNKEVDEIQDRAAVYKNDDDDNDDEIGTKNDDEDGDVVKKKYEDDIAAIGRIHVNDNRNNDDDDDDDKFTQEQKQKQIEEQQQKEYERQSQLLFSNDGIYNPMIAMKNDKLHNIGLPSTIYRASQNIPKWMKEYFDWHRIQTSKLNETNWYSADLHNEITKWGSRQPSDNNTSTSPRFLIISCLNRDQCGGLSDRIKPVLACIAIAAHTKRVLMIRWERPYPLEEFLVPNEINWTVPYYMVEELNQNPNPRQPNMKGMNSVSKIYVAGRRIKKVLRTVQHTVLETKIQSGDGGSTFYVCVIETMFGNQDIEVNTTGTYEHCDQLRHRFVDQESQQKAIEVYKSIYHDFFRSVFRPHPNVQRLITKRMIDSGLVAGQFIGAHFRSNYGLGKADLIGVENIVQSAKAQVRCAARMRPGYPVYFAGDSATVLNAVRHESKLLLLHKNITIRTPPPPPSKYNINNASKGDEEGNEVEQSPLHIEFDKGSIDEFYPVFVDLLVMGQSMCQSYGVGGFGTFASMLSYNASCYYSNEKCEGGESYYLPKKKCCMSAMYKEANKLANKEKAAAKTKAAAKK